MKTAIIAGWLAGVAMILDGLPWPAALAAPVATAGGALGWRQWGRGARLGLRLRVKLKRAAKTGSALERA